MNHSETPRPVLASATEALRQHNQKLDMQQTELSRILNKQDAPKNTSCSIVIVIALLLFFFLMSFGPK